MNWRRFLILPLLALAWPAWSAQVYVPLADFMGGDSTATNRTVLISGNSLPRGSSSAVILRDKRRVTTGTNNFFWISNAVEGVYLIQVLAPPALTEFRILVTNTTAVIGANSNLVATGNNTYPPDTVAWGAAASDARYALKGEVVGGGNATNVNFYPGQNTTWRTVGGSNVVDVLGTLTNSTTGNAATASTASAVVTAVTNQWRADDTVVSNGLSARIIATNAALVALNANALTNHFTPEAYFEGDLQTEGYFIANGPSSRFSASKVFFGTNSINWINTNGDFSLGGVVNAGGFVTAISFSGEGNNLNNLDASELTSGTVSKTRLPASIDSDTTGSAAKVVTAITNQWRADDTVVSNGLSARIIATNTALVNLHYNGAGVTNLDNPVVVAGINVIVTTNVAANGNRSYTVDSTGGGGGGPDPRFTSSAGTITSTSNTFAATTFQGALSGNAATATTASAVITAVTNQWRADDTVVSNGLSARIIATNAALVTADTVVSNGLSARIIATNTALVTADTTVSNGLSSRLLSTNNALAAILSETNATVSESWSANRMRVPPRMWGTWYDFPSYPLATNVTETYFLDECRWFRTNGWFDAGFRYMLLVEGAFSGYNADGTLIVSNKFPNGLKYLTTNAVNLGFIPGIYTSVAANGPSTTCMGLPGTCYTNLDAHFQQFADWGFQFYFIDACNGWDAWTQQPAADYSWRAAAGDYPALFQEKMRRINRGILKTRKNTALIAVSPNLGDTFNRENPDPRAAALGNVFSPQADAWDFLPASATLSNVAVYFKTNWPAVYALTRPGSYVYGPVLNYQLNYDILRLGNALECMLPAAIITTSTQNRTGYPQDPGTYSPDTWYAAGYFQVMTNLIAAAIHQDSAVIPGRMVWTDGTADAWVRPFGGVTSVTNSVLLINYSSSNKTFNISHNDWLRIPSTMPLNYYDIYFATNVAVTGTATNTITVPTGTAMWLLSYPTPEFATLHYNGSGITNMNSTVVVPGANVTITTNVAANGNRSYTVASSGGGGGGFWVLNSSSGDYTNLFGGRYDEPSTGKTAFYLGTNQTDYMIEGNLWRANLGIQFGATGGSIDGSGDFDLHDGSVNSLTINGTMSTPTFNVTTLNATNVFGFGTAYWTNAANTFNGTAFTNQSLTASRIMMTGANKQQVSAAASGATPINADGTAVTAIPISMLSDSTNVFYSANTLDFSVPHASTNMAGNITITTLNGVQNTAYNILVREWGANGADRTITFPTAWRAAPYGGTSVTVTNGTWCKLTLEVQVNYYTNAWFTWAY